MRGGRRAPGGSAISDRCCRPPASSRLVVDVPLTFGQQQLQDIVAVVDPTWSIIPTPVTIEGGVHETAVRTAMATVVHEHDALRMRVQPGGASQRVELTRRVELLPSGIPMTS